MKIAAALLVYFCCVTLPARAQSDSVACSAIIMRDARTALSGALYVLSAPARWDGKDWGWAGVTVGATGGAALLDHDLRSMMQRNVSASADHWADATVVYGDGFFAVGLSVGLYGTGLLIHDPWLRETAVLAGTAIIVSTVVTRVVKPIVGRARPYVNAGNGAFRMFSLDDAYNSFPSGHTVAAFSLSSVLAARINHPLATIGLYSLATLTALSRLYTDEHWFSDVVFGGIFAASVGRSLVLWREADNREVHSLHIVPSPNRIVLVYNL